MPESTVPRAFHQFGQAMMARLARSFEDEPQTFLDQVLELATAQRCLRLGPPVEIVGDLNGRFHGALPRIHKPIFIDRSGVLSAADPLPAQTQKNKDGLINALYILDIEMPDAMSESIFWHCGDLINHESRKSIEAVAFARCNRNAKQRRLSWIGCHDADRDGFGGIKAVIL
jgi:hypothetical protein